MRVVVGLGANLGDRLATMRRAALALGRIARVEATSRVWRTAPVGPPQPEFLNAAALLWHEDVPQKLLADLLAIEAELGRVRHDRWGPRAIDLDFLWAEGVVLDTPSLTLPHPRLHERAFALAPMLELVPGACDPRSGMRYVLPEGEVHATGDVL